MAGAVEVQVAREEFFEFRSHEESVGEGPCHTTAAAASSQAESMPKARQESATGEDEAPPCLTGPTALPQELGPVDEARCPAITVERHSRLAPYKPGKMTVVLDMDECLLHSKFHGPGAASEAYRQTEERPDSVNEVNSFWVALDDGDTAQVNKRPGLDPFLEALARDYNTIVFTAAMPDYAGPVLDYIDPKGTLFYQRLYRSSCRQVKGAFLKDLSVLGTESTDMSRTVLVDNNPLSFICQPTNGVLVASFYDDPSDTALASVMQLIRHLDQAGDVRPILKDMFRLDTLLGEYRSALFDDEDEDSLGTEAGALEEDEDSVEAGELDDELLGEAAADGNAEAEVVQRPLQGAEGLPPLPSSSEASMGGGPSSTSPASECVFDGRRSDCRKNSQDDDDSESVETEACSEESGESSLGESLTTSEEMEMDLGF